MVLNRQFMSIAALSRKLNSKYMKASSQIILNPVIPFRDIQANPNEGKEQSICHGKLRWC